MNYQPEVRRSLHHSDRKRTRSSYEDSSEASEDTSRNTKTRLSDQEEEEELEKKNFYKDFTCAICLEKLSDPHLLPDCCHRFCGGCIKESIAKGNRQCPSCRERITTKRCLRKDDLMEKLLARMEKLEEENAQLKVTPEKNEQRIIESDESSSAVDDYSVNDASFDAEFDESENEIKRPTTKKRRVNREAEQETSAVETYYHRGKKVLSFEERFNALIEFKSKHGHCNVPRAYKADDNLGQWVDSIRSMKSGRRVYKLSNERIKKLENIGFRWQASHTFEERFNALIEFKRKHGHCNVPRAYKADDNLGQWIDNIRSMKSGRRDNRGVYKLSNERIKKLENIGFRWQASHTFEERFNALIEFKRKHGHCNVPCAYKADDNLGQWVSYVRKMKSGRRDNRGVYKLTKKRIKKLEKIGFRWTAIHSFEERFNALKEYKSKHGHCNVPCAYKADDNLGQWVSRIRGMKSGSTDNSGMHKLTKERIKNLENIGFRWKFNE
ncbi:hypothetical protein CTEN210_00832 [Chaetoceros tenuissimus]|uniref:RING-type domain-containing protein n=1 Tax=Chaetoceros tenuissimus TaxID=426638 RepID=A0AAD3GZB4_9STRA|nr:hypothetical protein CTEN210_00832 [Chaetoceros tenuissimus]